MDYRSLVLAKVYCLKCIRKCSTVSGDLHSSHRLLGWTYPMHIVVESALTSMKAKDQRRMSAFYWCVIQYILE